MVLLLVLLRPASIRRFDKNAPSRSRAGASVLPKRADKAPEPPGVVTYALMKDKKLPSPAQRAYRRLLRPFASLKDRFGGKPRPGPMTVDTETRRPARPSAELENFLDARNREIARRKAEGATKPGPDDMLH